jgi:hypothetical protein
MAGMNVFATSWSDTRITARIPQSGDTFFKIVVTVGGVSSNRFPFNVTPPAPIITSISPASGPVGSVVQIIGNDFNSAANLKFVTFNGVLAQSVFWTNTEIEIQVPPGATTGDVMITVNDQTSNDVEFTVTPSPGGIALIQHVNRDAVGAYVATYATFPYPNTAGDLIVVAIRAGNSASQVFKVTDTYGNMYRQLIQAGQLAGQDSLAIYYAGNINKPAGPYDLNTVSVVDTVAGDIRFIALEYSGSALVNPVIGGGGRGAELYSSSPSAGQLNLPSVPDLALAAIETQNPATFTAEGGYTIEARVAAEPDTKPVVEDQVITQIGNISASASLGAPDNWAMVLAAFQGAAAGASPAPIITGLSPISGAAGTPVTITGNNFSDNQGNSQVTLNGLPMRVSSWSASSITVLVPSGATTGKIVVTVGGAPGNGVNFTVTAPA